MAEVKNSFLASKMNKDLDDRLIPNGEYRDARNISVGRSEDDDIGALENVLGNSKILGPGGIPLELDETLVCISYFMDNSNNIIYQFLTNYNGNEETFATSTHKITGTFKFTGVRYDSTLTQTETKVFTSGQFSVPYTSNNTSPSNNTFTCKLDGNNFVTTNVDGIKNSGLISLIGRRGSVENISLSLVENIAVGTHNLDNMPTGTNNVGMYVPDMSGNAYSSNPGTVTITTHNIASKRIVGTFQFTGASFLDSSTHSITNGSFDITYQ